MTKIKDKPASRPQWAERDPHARTGACLELWTDGRTFRGAHAEQPEILNGMGFSSGSRCSVKDGASQQIAAGVSGPGTRLFHVRVAPRTYVEWQLSLSHQRPSSNDSDVLCPHSLWGQLVGDAVRIFLSLLLYNKEDFSKAISLYRVLC